MNQYLPEAIKSKKAISKFYFRNSLFYIFIKNIVYCKCRLMKINACLGVEW